MTATIDFSSFDLVVVGSGFYGLTVAERAASTLNLNVAVLEIRDHIGGNAFSYFDEETGIEVHKYGSHLFHTSNDKVWGYVNKFSEFTDYRHRVFSISNNRLYTLPFNLQTFCEVYGRALSPSEVINILASNSRNLPKNAFESFEQRAINLVGLELYEVLIKGYTEKQWQTHPSDLPAAIINRLPIRANFNSDYFTDVYQGLPVDGYAKLFAKMTENPKIHLFTNSDFFDFRSQIACPLVYTGPLDKFFDYSIGALGWRTIDLVFESFAINDYQGNSVINYADVEVPFTRIHEFKHLHPERNYGSKTIIAREYSRFAEDKDEPYYPINSTMDRDRLMGYRTLAAGLDKTLIGGRLGSYQYLDMHMAIASALADFENIVSEWFK
jgi:UDP-galactopyranose mutase